VVKLGLAFLFPALAILGAAFAHHLLTLVWPGIQQLPSVFMSIGAASMIIAPLAFLALLFWVVTTRGLGSVAWFKLMTVSMVVTAVVPLMGVTLGWWRGAAARDSHHSVAPPLGDISQRVDGKS
jgi:Na+/H+-dicarboxylate symporter